MQVRVPSSPNNRVLWLTGSEQLLPDGVQIPSSIGPLLSVGFSVSTGLRETPALQLLESLNTNIFSWLPEITAFPVSSSVLAAGSSSFPS